MCESETIETQTEISTESILIQTDPEPVPIMISTQTAMDNPIMISTDTMTDDLHLPEDREAVEMGVQTCPEVMTSSSDDRMCAPMGTSDSNRDRIFVHSTPRNFMKNHNYDSDSISCYSSADSGADSSITLIKGSGDKLYDPQ